MTTFEESCARARLAEFEYLLKTHDWQHATRGYNEAALGFHRQHRLEAMRRSLIAEGLKAEVDTLWAKHCPFGACA